MLSLILKLMKALTKLIEWLDNIKEDLKRISKLYPCISNIYLTFNWLSFIIMRFMKNEVLLNLKIPV